MLFLSLPSGVHAILSSLWQIQLCQASLGWLGENLTLVYFLFSLSFIISNKFESTQLHSNNDLKPPGATSFAPSLKSLAKLQTLYLE